MTTTNVPRRPRRPQETGTREAGPPVASEIRRAGARIGYEPGLPHRGANSEIAQESGASEVFPRVGEKSEITQESRERAARHVGCEPPWPAELLEQIDYIQELMGSLLFAALDATSERPAFDVHGSRINIAQYVADVLVTVQHMRHTLDGANRAARRAPAAEVTP